MLESLKMILWFDVLFWLHSAQAVYCFSVSDKPCSNKQFYLTHTTTTLVLKHFGWGLQIKSPYPLSLLLPKLKFLVKKENFVLHRNNILWEYCVKNQMKLVFNFSTWNFKNYLQFKVKNKVHERNMGIPCYIICLFTLWFMYLRTCVKERKTSLHVFENINVNFGMVWHFDIKRDWVSESATWHHFDANCG